MDQHPRTHVLHIDASCADKQCPAVIDIDGLTGRRIGHKAVVGRIITDPVIAAALRDGEYVGDGEAVVLIPNHLYDQIQEG